MAQKIIYYLFIFLIHFIISKAQVNNQSVSNNERSLLFFVLTEGDSAIIDQSVEASLKKIVADTGRLKYKKFVIDATNTTKALENLSTIWDESFKNNQLPDLILDTTRSSAASDCILLLTSALGIPTLAARFGNIDDLNGYKYLEDQQKKHLIQIKPPADLLPYAIRQLAFIMNISNAAVIFDDNFMMDHKYKDLLLNIPTRHVIIKAKNIKKNKINDQMMQLRNLDIVNYFILGERDTICRYLETAENLNYVGRKYGWYALSLDHEFFPNCDCRNLSLLYFTPEIKLNSQRQYNEFNFKTIPYSITSAFYYDFVQFGFKAMKTAVDENKWPSKPFYISVEEYNNGTLTPKRELDLLSLLKAVSSSPTFTSSFATFDWGHKSGKPQASFDIKIEFNTVEKNSFKTSKKIGQWKPEYGQALEIFENNFELVKNHTAVTNFRVVTVQVPPFVEYDAENDRWFGYCIDLLNKIQALVGFEYEIYLAPDRKFGSMNETDKTWDGMIGELTKKKADIAIGTLSVMAERENVVDFTVPYYDLVGLSILMLKPKPPTSLFKFLTVLENEVWLCILGAYFFTSFLMWIFDRWSPYSYHNNDEQCKTTDVEEEEEEEEKRIFDLKECLWFCMTSLTPQGGGDSPNNLSGRLVAAVWWLFGFIIIASYTANLAAFLTVSRLETPIESLDDLSKQYKIEYAPLNPSEAYTYFERMSSIEKKFYEIWKDMALDSNLTDVNKAKLAIWEYPLSNKYTKMFEAMHRAEFPKSWDEALKRVRRQIPKKDKTEFAFIGDATEIKYLSMTTCDLLMVGDEFSRKPYAIAVQEGSPLKDQLNNAILNLLNQRELEKLKNKWWTDNPKRQKCEKEESQNDGISIQNIGGVFIVIFMGIILACMTLAYEYWFYRHKPRMEEKKRHEANKIHPQEKKVQNYTLKLRTRAKKSSEN